MSGVAVLLELVPIGLAIVSVVSCTRSFMTERRRTVKAASAMGALSSLMLVVAQSSWWVTYALNGGLQGTEWANIIWTLFNTLTMTTFIIMTSAGDSK